MFSSKCAIYPELHGFSLLPKAYLMARGREGFNLQRHRMWQAADKSAQNLHRYSSILVHDCSDRLVRVLFCASSICFNFHYHNMDPNVHRITDLQADTLLLSNHNNTNSKAGL
ncbi:unnamed protein product, partial [Musa acuminata var. zebrina]